LPILAEIEASPFSTLGPPGDVEVYDLDARAIPDASDARERVFMKLGEEP
jgi:hypothetical protein